MSMTVNPSVVDEAQFAVRRTIRIAAPIVGGGGGGRDTMAQAGGRDPEKLADALGLARRLLEQRLRSD